MKLLTILLEYDCNLLQWASVQRQRQLVIPAARLLSRTGDGYIPVVTILACLTSSNPMFRQLAWQLIVLFCIERTLYFLLKNSLRRKRPAESLDTLKALIVASDKFSFPSGHTSAASLYTAVMYIHFPILGSVLMVWALGVGISRVVLGVHYPSDIVAGASLGIAISAINISYPI